MAPGFGTGFEAIHDPEERSTGFQGSNPRNPGVLIFVFAFEAVSSFDQPRKNSFWLSGKICTLLSWLVQTHLPVKEHSCPTTNWYNHCQPAGEESIFAGRQVCIINQPRSAPLGWLVDARPTSQGGIPCCQFALPASREEYAVRPARWNKPPPRPVSSIVDPRVQSPDPVCRGGCEIDSTTIDNGRWEELLARTSP
ncbi:uncharacterized protein PGTG_05601 [Puccinia graminis f. sp. tritici CRL 75-36-700-3]|uniref:Uncharacterized protein n=1 Tax=Puccinia graminis f. sp. tritici (strain CRL 75-36-700-3 / race SCCL) TaxID=418459 RepID=E3K4W5_PUCGT|nr:uncharacterized protein PGTG_05601 [Puccinia graminis f. sp. tritici CRL 75-36-700-3]EFP79280.2 hypothetical protein PGTG_05601 [Puccinia graminis f. sp. tritici CRL 75-36-700-3]